MVNTFKIKIPVYLQYIIQCIEQANIFLPSTIIYIINYTQDYLECFFFILLNIYTTLNYNNRIYTNKCMDNLILKAIDE